MPTIEEVKSARERELFAIPGVVGVGIVDGELGEPTIAVYIADAEATTRVPTSLDGFPVKTQFSGEFDALTPGEARAQR